jgi:hypothetical protein
MANASVPEPVGERQVREEWIEALGAALALRTEQDYDYRFKTAPQVRTAAQDIGAQLAGPYGVESPQVYRAVAALVTMCHPTVLALLLAGIPPAGEVKWWRRIWTQ